MNKNTVEITITGIVQGVGFRPFLFNLARKLGLKGYILNRGNAGVRLVLQGDTHALELFIEGIKFARPEISYIEDIIISDISDSKEYNNLEILKSEEGRGNSLTLPPDIAICEDCIKDMKDLNQTKYYQYPFIACAVCGPRFTTVRELPYDRERSTMIEFPFCRTGKPSCIQEYTDFNNRRFHAQTFACSKCGPNYELYNSSKELIEEKSIDKILKETARRINEKQIAAIKGIGGVHLVCLAEDEDVVVSLRKRKGKRKYKPFALMVPNLDIIENDFNISKKEKEIITSFRRPIVLLEKKNKSSESKISNQIAPGLNNIGFMLPYSGIHYLLFDYIGNKPLIYTSGNVTNIPMGIDNEKIFDQLKDLADFFLLHNRTIYQRADDSVLRVHGDKVKLIRRSRGYVPEYLPLPFETEITGALATGPELAATGAVLRKNRIFPTQHIGNVRHLETYEFLKDALFHMQKLLQIQDSEIKFIACDAHPLFITTNFAKELANKFNVNLYPVQHHYAHVLSLMAENRITFDEKIIGISTDGVGYGDDGNVWGGEILISSYDDYKRVSHLEYQLMIGGDRCTKYPARMAASILLKALGKDQAIKIFDKISLKNDLEYKDQELNTIISQFDKANNQFPNSNIPLSSSTGRIFDTVSYLLGASNIKTYQGEPAMRLEGLASKGNPNNIDLNIGYQQHDGICIIKTSDLVLDILDLLEDKRVKVEDVAASFQIAMGNTFADVAINIAKAYEIAKIGLTGGVAYNYFFSQAIKRRVIQGGFQFLEHDLVPPGDAGISIGQLISGIFRYFKDK